MRTALLALLMAMPVAAPTGIAGPPSPERTLPGIVVSPAAGRETGEIRERIRDGRREGSLSRRDGRVLRRQAGVIDSLADRYGSDGLSEPEMRELNARAMILRDAVNARRTGVPAPR